MRINKEQLENQFESWTRIVLKERKKLNLSDLDFSALFSWLPDCFFSFNEIFSNQLEKMNSARPDDYELLFECVMDIYFELKHIQSHIEAAEEGFLELQRVLEKGKVSE